MQQVICRCSRTLLSAFVFGGLALAAPPIASVRTADIFQLDGHSINTPGVTSWPLVLGDELTSSQNSPVVILFKDGSRVKLNAASRAKIAGSDEQPKVVLLSGTLDFKLVSESSLTVTNLESERRKAEAPPIAFQTATVASATGVAAVDRFPVLLDSRFLLPSTITTRAGVRAAPLVTTPPVRRHL